MTQSQSYGITMNINDRHNYSIDATGWREETTYCNRLREILTELLQKWGTFLDCHIYNEAFVYFLGGKEKVICPVKVYFNRKPIGTQNMHSLDSETVFHVSAITRAFKGYEKNIRSLIEHTKIKNVQWINFNKSKIRIKTLTI